ncbi:hypothetical protein EW145_g2221 [Phellinidium pouzarii]|uniref:Uncharacterized protein n=1 Tax=Phellinidium pouzarii TaxID=167371 RepID=A0A4S4LC87_9AGAM|nr:hypothetical protein EW145_g2221 [Phellinidium pouzarii]
MSMSSSTQARSPPSRPRARSFAHLSRHTLKQLKFVLPGGFVTYVLGTLARFWQLVEEESGWARLYARMSLACGLMTVVLFLYILLVPWLRGAQPNVRDNILAVHLKEILHFPNDAMLAVF